MTRVLKFEVLPYIDRDMDLSNDRTSCRLWLASVLDSARSENSNSVIYRPADGNDSIALDIDEQTCHMVSLPAVVRELFLRYAQEIVVGRFRYQVFKRLRGENFPDGDYGPLAVSIGGNCAVWNVRCSPKSLRFVRVRP